MTALSPSSAPAVHGAGRPSLAEALASLAPLLDYPTDALPSHALACRRSLAADWPDAAGELTPFVAWSLNEPLQALEERYTRTFDLSAVCAPYAGIHIFGEESFARGELMARLREAFTRYGFDAGPELPDHIAVLLRFAPKLDPGELEELIECCLAGVVGKMADRLDPLDNPYRAPVRALRRLIADETATGGIS